MIFFGNFLNFFSEKTGYGVKKEKPKKETELRKDEEDPEDIEFDDF